MKTDLYTKAVLTVIAIALSAIALQHSLTPAYAQSSIQKVVICDGYLTNLCAGVTTTGALEVRAK
jgi:hypothetical protein